MHHHLAEPCTGRAYFTLVKADMNDLFFFGDDFEAILDIFEDEEDIENQRSCNELEHMSSLYSENHIMKTHTNEEPYECNVCSKYFSERSNLTGHMRTHTEENPYECDFCDKVFSQKSDLTRHLQIHSNEKPYECVVCNKRFSEHCTLTAHMRTHTNEKPYECDLCNKRFAHNHYLKSHMRTHTNEKPYECDVCHTRFAQNHHLKIHMRTHTNAKPYKCDVQRAVKAKKRRKLIGDEVINVSAEEIKSQLSDTTDIVTTHWTTNSVENQRMMLNEDAENDEKQLALNVNEEQELLGEPENQRNYSMQDLKPDVTGKLDSTLKRHIDKDIYGMPPAQRSRLGLDDGEISQIPSVNNEPPAPSFIKPPPQQLQDSQQHFMPPHPASLHNSSQILPQQLSMHNQSSFFQPELPNPFLQPSNTIPPPQPVLDILQSQHQPALIGNGIAPTHANVDPAPDCLSLQTETIQVDYEDSSCSVFTHNDSRPQGIEQLHKDEGSFSCKTAIKTEPGVGADENPTYTIPKSDFLTVEIKTIKEENEVSPNCTFDYLDRKTDEIERSDRDKESFSSKIAIKTEPGVEVDQNSTNSIPAYEFITVETKPIKEENEVSPNSTFDCLARKTEEIERSDRDKGSFGCKTAIKTEPGVEVDQNSTYTVPKSDFLTVEIKTIKEETEVSPKCTFDYLDRKTEEIEDSLIPVSTLYSGNHIMDTHTKEDPYECNVCNKCFSESGSLIVHMRTHTNEKSYKCDVCNKCKCDINRLLTILITGLIVMIDKLPLGLAKCVKKLNTVLDKRGYPSNMILYAKFVSSLYSGNHIMDTHTKEDPYECNVCYKCFSESGSLTVHMQTHTNEKSYKCDVCTKFFARKINLAMHMRSHINEKPYELSSLYSGNRIMDTHTKEDQYECNVCYKLSSLYSGNHIMDTHTKEDLYECNVCYKCFSERCSLTVHMRIHTSEKPFKCDVCSKCFSTRSILTGHMRTHTNEKPYECDVCNKCFSERTSLREHMQIHTKENPYECDVCHKCFSNRSSLILHVRTHTNEKPYECELCNRRFGYNHHLKSHMRTHTNEKPYECDVCNTRFAHNHHLKIHMRTHTNLKPYECDVCHKFFSVISNLIVHMRTHTNEKPYECIVCNKTFLRKGQLTRHMRTHTNEKPYACVVCNKGFSYKNDLTRHMRTHTNEKPYECDVCNKYFSESGGLTKHKRTHTNEKPYKCDVCCKTFSQNSNLKTHMRKHIK
ncbi:Zinc finger protein 420 [Nymphon striatum]|nr:Zinc finger protein 420 [Nymphon striatum]